MDKDYNVEELNINISNHCIQRYIERVKNNNRNITVANDDENGIINEIKKLFISSDFYFEGQIGKSTNIVRVYCNRNGWIFLVSKDNTTLITVYKVDLLVDDDELDQMYVEKALEKIKTLKDIFDEQDKDAREEISNCQKEINLITSQIDEYEDLIKQLRKRKESLQLLMQTSSSKTASAKKELKDVLEDFIIKDKLKSIEN